MPDSSKWGKKGNIFISKWIIKQAEIFQVFKTHGPFNMGIGLWTFLRGFILHLISVAGKGAPSFLGSPMQNREEWHNWVKGAKESILHTAGIVLNEPAKRVKQGWRGKRKRKKTEPLKRL